MLQRQKTLESHFSDIRAIFTLFSISSVFFLLVFNSNVKNESTTNENESTIPFGVGTFVILKYENDFYPAKIVNEDNGDYYCCAIMRQSGMNHWEWPDPPDLIWYHKDDLICIINEPEVISARGVYDVPEMKEFLKYV
ncbi:hypothetical protein RI129_009574 [Pyrocoelia pectoralis]|uniref:Uncharacterized protein n=1 Tax=Pyrocoelia pectoralis TaxID=417401 RepID=A0AAN7ZF12_9COLE